MPDEPRHTINRPRYALDSVEEVLGAVAACPFFSMPRGMSGAQRVRHTGRPNLKQVSN